MKINFTKKEYRLLLDLIYLGQWMIEAHETGGSGDSEKYEMVAQKICSYAKEMDCEDLIKPSKELGGYYPTLDFEEGEVHEYIDKYNNNTFWDELINRLTERDVQTECALKNIEIGSVEEFWKISTPHEEKYAHEFEKHGLSRLGINET